tara:strand:+ start:1612 stop:1806 length:195 start_codon:yes stop_codon:yes gene_type:complete
MTHKIRNNFRNLFGRSLERAKSLETGCQFLYDGSRCKTPANKLWKKDCPQDYENCSSYKILIKN